MGSSARSPAGATGSRELDSDGCGGSVRHPSASAAMAIETQAARMVSLPGWECPMLARIMPEDEGSPFPEPVEIPIGDSLDLHYFPPREVGEIVDAYLEAAAARGLREVRIIHGRGRGVQRYRVHRHLARSPFVERFTEAPADRGRWGATLVWLRAAPD